MPKDNRSVSPTVQQSLIQRLERLHESIRAEGTLSEISRIAVALYDSGTGLLKTFIHSSDGPSPMDHLVAPLADLPSLVALAERGERRVIGDLSYPAELGQGQAQRLLAFGFRSSYTVPILYKGTLYGFLFFNSFAADFFTPAVLHRLSPYADLIALAVVGELDTVRMMQAAVKVIRQVSSVRDQETGAHLARMAHYSRLIAVKLASEWGLDDEFIEFLFQFAPLHDVGKVAVPDAILLKPGRLTADEFAVMRGHVAKGVEIIDLMIRDFGIDAMPHFRLLRNVVAYHHEAIDGSGYPHGLSGSQIPAEARICAVADVFDALTSFRPYKSAWSNEESLALLQDQAGTKFDAECVAVLATSMDEIREIQAKFAESLYD